MRRFQATITLAAPAHVIWVPMSDVVCWPQWMSTFSHITALDGRELALTRRFKVEQPGLRSAVWTVTQLTPDTGFTWQSYFPGLSMVADHRLEQHPRGTVLRLDFVFSGIFGWACAALLGRLVQRYLKQECTAYGDRFGLEHATGDD